jgi:hypothetical protein
MQRKVFFRSLFPRFAEGGGDVVSVMVTFSSLQLTDGTTT